MRHNRQDSIFLEQGKSIHQSQRLQKESEKSGGFLGNVTSMFKMSPSPNKGKPETLESSEPDEAGTEVPEPSDGGDGDDKGES